jgi:hypothetical protein
MIGAFNGVFVLSLFPLGASQLGASHVSDTVGDLVLLYLNGCGVDGVGYVTLGESSSSSIGRQMFGTVQ